MSNKSRIGTSLYLLIAVMITVLSGCTKPPEQPKKETPASATAEPAPAQQPAQQEPQKTPPAPPPTISEARSAVERIYKDTLSVDAGRNAGFTVGDFNGDGSQDIAVVVRPSKEKLADINHELASWMIREPVTESLPQLMERRNSSDPKPRPVITERDELLLAVIHGYGSTGWRNVEAQQTYLLKNAVGNNMKAESKDNVLKASTSKRPPLLGDVLGEALAGQQGFIYYTGATYAWYDPRYYRGERPKRMAH